MKQYTGQLTENMRKANFRVRPPHPLWIKSEAWPDNETVREDL